MRAVFEVDEIPIFSGNETTFITFRRFELVHQSSDDKEVTPQVVVIYHKFNHTFEWSEDAKTTVIFVFDILVNEFNRDFKNTSTGS